MEAHSDDTLFECLFLHCALNHVSVTGAVLSLTSIRSVFDTELKRLPQCY